MDNTVPAMCAAGAAIILLGTLRNGRAIAAARGLDRPGSLATTCFAAPLGIFGALHLFGPQFVIDLVPDFMPWHSFWVVFVGCALIAASVSIAGAWWVRWSGILVGILMFLFVAMIHLPGAVREPGRIIWTIVLRESSFGGAGLVFAGAAMRGESGRLKRTLPVIGRIAIALAALLFGVEHFLHPTLLPGVPLLKEMPEWVPGRVLIDYATGAALLAAAGSFLMNWNIRTAAAVLGGWLLLLVLLIYGPVLVDALLNPDPTVRLVGVNYFADTLLFTGTILSLAKPVPNL